VQIDIDGRQLGVRYPVEVPLVGDAAETVRALLGMIQRRGDRSWREKVEGWVRRWGEIVRARADAPAEPMNPRHVVRSLSGRCRPTRRSRSTSDRRRSGR
jgi:pyruvate dehydrogenase (quinone)